MTVCEAGCGESRGGGELVSGPFEEAEAEPKEEQEQHGKPGVAVEEGRAVHVVASKRLLATFSASRFALA